MKGFRIVKDWKDSMIWCPSQCEMRVSYNEDNYVIYLRWRWSNPWTARIIKVDEKFSSASWLKYRWEYLDVPEYNDTQVDELKVAAVYEAQKLLSTGWTPDKSEI